jgi:ribosomal protein S18 acetylase RimI-like enzyme
MIIRPAIISDLPRLIVLFQQEVAYQQQLSPFFDLAADFDWRNFAEMKLKSSNEQVVVAERDHQLVGYINVRALRPTQRRFSKDMMRRLLRRETPPSIVRRGTVGWIEDCYVEPQFQRQGTGSALVQQGTAWLQAQGVTRIELSVSAKNHSGIAFWQKRGFSSFRHLLSKELD